MEKITEIPPGSRDDLRNHRNFVYEAVSTYVAEICGRLHTEHGNWRIMDSIRTTRIRIPHKFVPENFRKMILDNNGIKKYRIEFCQSHPDYVEVIIKNKPLIAEGQVILLYFFRELLQFLNKRPSKVSTIPGRSSTEQIAATR